MKKDSEKSTIGMLLDIEHFNGENTGRLAPLLSCLLLIAAPILFYVWSGLFYYIPVWLFTPLEIFFSIRVVLKIKGRENYRLNLYRKQLNDNYLAIADMNRIKTVQENGCLEYLDNKVHYFIIGFNGTIAEPLKHSALLSEFLTTLIDNYDYNIYIQNITDTSMLSRYYDKVNRFQRNSSASNFVEILDYDKQLTADTSLVQATIIELIASRSEWKVLQQHIQAVLRDYTLAVFKTVYLVTDQQEINAIINRDIDSVVNIDELLRIHYKTEDYKGSHVLTYDVEGKSNIVLGDTRTVKIIPDSPEETFHISYEDE